MRQRGILRYRDARKPGQGKQPYTVLTFRYSDDSTRIAKSTAKVPRAYDDLTLPVLYYSGVINQLCEVIPLECYRRM